MDLDFDKDVGIDKLALDIECIDQPRRFKKWSDAAAEARKERAKAKQRLRVVKAEVMLEIQKDPMKVKRLTSEGEIIICALDKTTDPTVAAMIEAHPNVVDAVIELADADHNAEILEGAKEAFQDRKKELENLVSLYLSGYWAPPRLPRKDADKLSDEGSTQQKTSLQRRMPKRGA